LIDPTGAELIPFGAYSYIQPSRVGNMLICYQEQYQAYAYDLVTINGELIIDSCQFIDPLPDGSRFWIERGSYSGYVDTKGAWIFKQSRFNYLDD